MQKDKRNILIFTGVIIVVIFLSYFIFTSGVTGNLRASIKRLSGSTEDYNVNDLPVIDFVVNSSGEEFVNTDVAITVNASSNSKIDRLYYSFDMENWKVIKDDLNDTEITSKIVFTDDMNEDLYIIVENENGYRSYAYKTSVKIDKENPKVKVSKDGDDTVIKASDNNELKYIQYSYDNENWDEEEISGEKLTLTKKDFNYKYVRVVDMVGNISKEVEVK